MKIAVDFQSGPCITASTTEAIQLSPVRIDHPLCCEFRPCGITMDRAVSVPAFAAWMTRVSGATFRCWLLYWHSANVGQIAHPYGSRGRVSPGGRKIRHERPDAPSLSMIVGMYCTGDGRYGPVPSFFGMHDGSIRTLPDGARHGASRLLSQPHPGPIGRPFAGTGLSPVKPSRRAATSSMCDPQLETTSDSKVWSAM